MLRIGIQRSNLMRFPDLSAPATDALRLLVSPPIPTICDHKWPRSPRQIMISSFQLLQIGIINQAFLPKMLKEMKVRSARSQSMP